MDGAASGAAVAVVVQPASIGLVDDVVVAVVGSAGGALPELAGLHRAAEGGHDRVVEPDRVVDDVEVGDRVDVRCGADRSIEDEAVVARTTSQPVVSGSAIQEVVAAAAVQGVVAGRAIQTVGAGIAGDDVVEGVARAIDVTGAQQRQVFDRTRNARRVGQIEADR